MTIFGCANSEEAGDESGKNLDWVEVLICGKILGGVGRSEMKC